MLQIASGVRLPFHTKRAPQLADMISRYVKLVSGKAAKACTSVLVRSQLAMIAGTEIITAWRTTPSVNCVSSERPRVLADASAFVLPSSFLPFLLSSAGFISAPLAGDPLTIVSIPPVIFLTYVYFFLSRSRRSKKNSDLARARDLSRRAVEKRSDGESAEKAKCKMTEERQRGILSKRRDRISHNTRYVRSSDIHLRASSPHAIQEAERSARR